MNVINDASVNLVRSGVTRPTALHQECRLLTKVAAQKLHSNPTLIRTQTKGPVAGPVLRSGRHRMPIAARRRAQPR
jgi:hypothetical protein